MQSIHFSTTVFPQSSAASVPLNSAENDAVVTPLEQKEQHTGKSSTVGHLLSQALLASGGDAKTQQLAARFERGDVSASSLKQLAPLLETMPVTQSAQMANALGQAAQQAPDMQAVFRQLQGIINHAQMTRQQPATAQQDALSRSVNDGIHPRGDFRSLVLPADLTPVSAQQAERSMHNVMGNPALPLTGLMNLNIEQLALQAANLGIKTFSDTASSVSKSQSIATDVRKIHMDKKIEEFAKEHEKSIKQQENAKKGGIFGTILKWVMPVVSVVAMVFVPMSLPLMVGMVGATVASTASAAMSTASLVMGPNAPGWLQKLNNIMDWVSTSLSFVVGASAMWLGEKIANGVIHGLELLTNVAQGLNTGITGMMNTKLQKEINKLDLKIEWREVMVDLFKQASETNSKRLEKATDSWGSGHHKLIDVMMDNATLRSRIAKSMV